MQKIYDPLIHELQTRNLWQEQRTYSQDNNDGPLYSIDTPPPTVSGNLHIGHIFSYTHTDIIARYKRMQGFSIFYPFGFDDNGLPTERYVEKKRDVQAYQMARSAFISICLEETKLAAKTFKTLWQKIGLSVDWDFAYSTISDDVRRLSQLSFIELYNKGYVYRKAEPALYCTFCRTSVAQAELDDKETKTFFNDVVFKDQKGNDLIIATTRPELLPACVALLYNPEDIRYKHLKGQTATVPLFNTIVPIIADELVQIDKGSGLVMCCTFGDKTDVEWYKKHNLSYKQAIGFDGKCTELTGFLAGLKVHEARIRITEELIKHNLLIRQRETHHAVNVHERCKKEIEYTIINQWFVRILDYKKELLEIAEQIEWYPAFMKSRYTNWVENIGWDWGISRQRFFGIPFPVWHCSDCNAIIMAKVQSLPVDPQETEAPISACNKCGSANIKPDTDVMDTWNTSSLSPYICAFMKDNVAYANPYTQAIVKDQFLPMSMRPQAHDIIRTWAFYTIVKTWMHHETIPWKTIVISGHVLSDQKEKISKSKGNSLLEPDNLLKQYPADAVRYWTASGSLGHDILFSEQQLKIGQRLITKLWNAFRFIEEHVAQVNPAQVPEQFGSVNEWILDAASHCFERYCTYFEQHEFSLALDQVEQFFWRDFCDNYLELIKQPLFNNQLYSEQEINAIRWTLHNIGMRILQLYAPYLPYVTETIYQEVYKRNSAACSLHQTKYTTIQIPYAFEQSKHTMAVINTLIGEIRKLKTSAQVSLKTPLEVLALYSDSPANIAIIEKHKQLLIGISHAQEITYNTGTLENNGMEKKDELFYASIQV